MWMMAKREELRFDRDVLFFYFRGHRLYIRHQALGSQEQVFLETALSSDLLESLAIFAGSLRNDLFGHAHIILALEAGVGQPVTQVLLFNVSDDPASYCDHAYLVV